MVFLGFVGWIFMGGFFIVNPDRKGSMTSATRKTTYVFLMRPDGGSMALNAGYGLCKPVLDLTVHG